jgi:hypothetical protein
MIRSKPFRFTRHCLALVPALAVTLAGSCGCSRGRAASSTAGSTPRAASIAGGSSSAPVPSSTPNEFPAPEPTVDYASLEKARDAVERLVRRSVNLKNPAVSVHRDTVTFQYWYAHAAARGWIFRVEVRDTSVCPIETIEDAMQNAGWAQAYGYQADGPDGGDMGFVTRRFLCLIQGQWEGGDDSDTTYVPAPGCKVTATIVPRRADDVMH